MTYCPCLKRRGRRRRRRRKAFHMYRYEIKIHLCAKKKKWTEMMQIFNKPYECIIANTSSKWQQAAHTTYQLIPFRCSTRAIEKHWRHFWGKVRWMGCWLKKHGKTERARGLGKKTWEEIGKGIKWQPWDSRQEEDITHSQPAFEEQVLSISSQCTDFKCQFLL